MMSERRAARRAEHSALATKRIEERDQLVLLIDSGRRWAVNLETTMLGFVASIEVTMGTEHYKAMGRFGDAYRLKLLTAELVIDDPTLGPLIGALTEHLGNLSAVTEPVLTSVFEGRTVQIQLDALRAYIDQANEMLNRLGTAARKWLAGGTA